MLPRWRQNYRMLFNRYWGPGREAWLPSPQVTEILPIIRASVGFMTDQRITHNIAPAAIPGAPDALADALAPRVRTALLAMGLIFAVALLGGMSLRQRIVVGRDPPRIRVLVDPGRDVLARLCISRR